MTAEALPVLELTGPQLARVLGISTRTLLQHAAEGRIPRSSRGRFTFPAAVTAFFRHQRAAAAAGAETAGLAKSRRDLAEQRAGEISLRIEAVRSTFVPHDLAAEGWRRIDEILGRRFGVQADIIAAAVPKITTHDRATIAGLLRESLQNVREEAIALQVVGAVR